MSEQYFLAHYYYTKPRPGTEGWHNDFCREDTLWPRFIFSVKEELGIRSILKGFKTEKQLIIHELNKSPYYRYWFLCEEDAMAFKLAWM